MFVLIKIWNLNEFFYYLLDLHPVYLLLSIISEMHLILSEKVM